MVEKLYIIRRRSDGYFSRGGMTPKWSKSIPKVWVKQTLHSHLAMVHSCSWGTHRNKNLRNAYDDCDIIEVDLCANNIYDVVNYQLNRQAEKEK